MRVCIISVGNELLLGRTINTNASYIAQKLSNLGFTITEILTCSDDKNAIKSCLTRAQSKADVLICTGGLGPTDDDISRQIVADFFEKKLIFNRILWGKITRYYQKITGSLPPVNNKAQAFVPQDFKYFTNKMGTAPALYFLSDGKMAFFLPGVPKEMKNFLKENVIPKILNKFSKKAFFIETLHTFGLSESIIAQKMEHINIKKGVNLAYLPQNGGVDLRVYSHNIPESSLLIDHIKTKFKSNIYGSSEDTLEKVLHKKFLKKKLSFSLAESCTGGLVSSAIVSIPGSSVYFKGGIVCYDDSVKEIFLNISSNTLKTSGAVSRLVASQMAQGVAKKFCTDISGAITGIAGPSGGTITKPVGLVYLAVYNKGTITTQKKFFTGDRTNIRIQSKNYLLWMILKLL